MNYGNCECPECGSCAQIIDSDSVSVTVECDDCGVGVHSPWVVNEYVDEDLVAVC